MSFALLRLHRPPRAVMALGQALAAVVLGGLAWWCWQRGMIVTVQDGVDVVRIDGRWWAAATALATLAGLLLLVLLAALWAALWQVGLGESATR